MNIQDTYQTTILFAATKHQQNNQTIPGTNLPYLLHLSNVAMEILMAGQHTPAFDTRFAVQVALLHDVLEDTDTTFDELTNNFDQHIAEYAHEHPVAIQHIHFQDHTGLRDRMDTKRRIYTELKGKYYSFLSKAM
jgi:(p)ppGpp synthase/HD superfamily hydrolase